MLLGRSAGFENSNLLVRFLSLRLYKKFSVITVLSACLMCQVLFTGVSAQGIRVWQMSGPFGGDVSSLAVDPRDGDHVIIGTHDGQIFQSKDGGATWRRIRPGLKLNGYEIKCFLFDRERAGVVYAGLVQIKDARDDISGGGIFRSTDNGETWTEIEIMRGRSVRGMFQSASDSNVIVVAARDSIYRTRDRGENWERITPDNEPELRGFHSVSIDPRDANIIYVGTWHLPWKTTDGGLTWKRAGSKDTGMLDDSDIFAIQIDEKNPDTVLMSACSGIYCSVNASAKWSKLQGIPYDSRRTHVIYRHPVHPEIIFAGTTEGLWRSADDGKTWNVVSSPKLIINAIAIHPDHPNRVYVGTEDMGVLISEDKGETYALSNAGFISRQVRTVLADNRQRGRVYAGVIFDGAGGGFFISEDGGKTWQQSVRGMGMRDVYSIYQNQANPDTLYAGTNQGLFRSDDRGLNWVWVEKEATPPAKTPPRNRKKKTISASRSGASAGTKGAVSTVARARAGTGVTGASVRNVAQTRLQAGTKPVSSGSPQSDSSSSQTVPPELTDLRSQVFSVASLYPRGESGVAGILAATWEGLYRTTDEKKGWEMVTLAGSSAGQGSGKLRPIVRSVATSSQAPGLVLAGTEEGLFISRDNGNSFVPLRLDGEMRRIQTIVFDPRTADTIYVGTSNAFFRSLNGGQTWERRGGGLRLASAVSAITVNPNNPDEIFAGDYNQGGFYRSLDRGKTWELLNTSDLPSQRVWSLTADPFDSSKLYAGSFSGGVYVITRQAGSR